MKNYKAETILNSSSFPEIWVSNLQEKHIDLLIERILFFMMDNKELSDLQWGNLIRFCETISPDKFYKFFVVVMNDKVFMNHIKNSQCSQLGKLMIHQNHFDKIFDNRKEYDRLINKIIKRHVEKTARK